MNAHEPSHHQDRDASWIGRRIRIAAASAGMGATLAVACLAGAASSHASPAWSDSPPAMLAHAHTIGADVSARARLLPGIRLEITKPAPTDVVESFTLLSEDLLETRYMSARHGVWYSICPARVCASPARRFARPAADYAPRRMALELALRTFFETNAAVVAVSLPTSRRVAFIVERDELLRAVGSPSLSSALSDEPRLDPDPPAWLRRSVDELTRPRTFVFAGLEYGATGGPSWAGIPRWPVRR